jgi:1,4-alpha-glucan branching enzyme
MPVKGYLCLMLHAHLPFVRHPEHENFLEEHWLYEAINETYIPLLNVFHGLAHDEIDFRLTMSLTPPLVSMLRDPLLQERYLKYIDRLIELSEKEIERTGHEPHYHGLALMYNRRFNEAKELFLKFDLDLVSAFKLYQDMGYLEIITCGATHGFFPILNINPSSVRSQINIAVDHYYKTFDCAPRGIWLPECGYYPGVDEFLKNAGIRYFFVDSHGIMHADPRPRYSVYAPLFCPSGVAAFGRDIESSKQVWSSKEGYPGDPDYREYYRDIGFELEYDYIRPYIHPEGFRINTGMKYWRITGKTDYKEAYRPDWAQEKAAQHAGNFLLNRQKQMEHLNHHMDRRPIVVAPYDAELFGHWWFEGPMFIDYLIRKTVCDQNDVQLATPSDYLAHYPTNQVAVPSQSSWGDKGYGEYWLDGSNDWIYRHIHKAGHRMVELANRYADTLRKGQADSVVVRSLHQAARELLLAESSDWPFIMKAGTMVPYAEKRIQKHIGRFNRLYNDILAEKVDEVWLGEIEYRDNLFSGLECAKYYIQDPAFFKPLLVSSQLIEMSAED